MFCKGSPSKDAAETVGKFSCAGDTCINKYVVEEQHRVDEVTKTFMCSNYNCPSMMVKDLDSEEIYCSVSCHRDYIGILKGEQTYNVGERNLSRLGRGGTGLLEERDKIVVSFDLITRTRRCTWFPVPVLLEQLNGREGDGKVELKKGGQKDNCTSITRPLISISQELHLFQKHLVLVVFAVSPWEIYVQTRESSARALEIQKWCKEGLDPAWKSPNWSPVVGKFCIAGYKGERYRAKILQVSDEFISVQYVDYGNTALVNVDQVSEIGLKLLQLMPQCFQIKIANIKPAENRDYWNEESIRKVKAIENSLVFVEPVIQDLNDPGIMLSRMNKASSEGVMLGDFGAKLVRDGLAVQDNCVTEVVKKKTLFESESLPSIEKRSLLPERQTQVRLGHIENPSFFYVIVDTDEHSKMKTRMAKYVMLKKIFYSPQINDVCGAKFAGHWKRAKKLADENEKIKVISIDDGDIAVVPPLDIIKLKKDMLDTPPLAILCCLHNIETVNEQWTDDATNSMKKLVTDNVPCYVSPIELDAEKSFVKLLTGEDKQDFGKILVDLGMAREKILPCSSTKKNVVDCKNESCSDDPELQIKLDAEYSGSQGKVHAFTASDMLTTVKLRNNDAVFVRNFWSFNRCFVQTYEGAENLLDLQEQIAAYITDAKPLIELPTVGEVVLGTLRDGIYYHRAIVEKIESENIVKIKFLDLGSENSLHYSDLRYPTVNITQAPVNGKNVLLSGVPDDPEKILTTDFNIYCSKLSKNLRIELINEGNGEIVECKLYYVKDSNRCVNEEILNLGKWKWEVAFDIGMFTDCDIFKYEGNLPPYFYNLSPVKIPLGEEIKMQVALYADPKTFMCIPCIPSLERDFQVMETQMNLYIRTVKESSFFPAMNQLYFSKKTDGKWMRCTRFDHYGSLAVDYGTSFGFEGNEVRRMPKDFVQIPTYAVACLLDGIPKSLDAKMEKVIKGILRHRKVLTCTATAFCKTSNIYSIKCEDVINELADGRHDENTVEVVAINHN